MATDPDVRAEIRRQAEEGLAAASIYRDLQRRADFQNRVPTLRTVQRMVDVFSPKDPVDEDTWTWRDAEPGEAQAVLESLGLAITRTRGSIASVSREQAAWIVKVRSAVPQMPAGAAWWFAAEYVTARDATHLDASLAVARLVREQKSGQLGLTVEQVAAHVGLHVQRWLRRDLLAWAGSKETADLYVAAAQELTDLKAVHSLKEHDSMFIRLTIDSRQKED